MSKPLKGASISDREKIYTIKIKRAQLDHFHKHLGYIRCWIDGFAAAGKQGPYVADTLRLIQLLLNEAKEGNDHGG